MAAHAKHSGRPLSPRPVLTLIAMGGEVLSDYSLRLKREYSGSRLWVARYCHESISYIPSERVLREGGYEGRDAMLYGGRRARGRPNRGEDRRQGARIGEASAGLKSG